MTESEQDPGQESRVAPADAPLPQAQVRPRGSLSLVWLIPLVALITGGWLLVKTLNEQGPSIQIEFSTAAGLEAGKTRVKFKDVEVGQVSAIDVSDDLKGVVVTAELNHNTEPLLSKSTRFWVVRPRVTVSRVSGLDTLFSGAYIALDPGQGDESKRHFKGLEEPPLFTTAEPGKRFVLRAATLGSLNIGSPVYYRQIQVGQVVGYSLDADGKAVSIELFVSAPHDALVTTNSRFWNASGVDMSISAEGVNVDTQSLLSVIIGGVAFDVPDTLQGTGAPAQDSDVFPLYANRDAAHAHTYINKKRYLLFFKSSVKGLSTGAPVLLRGIAIGRVLDVQLQFDIDKGEFLIPVLIEIEPERIAVKGGNFDQFKESNTIQRLVGMGLRGQLKTGSLLTGRLYVDLDFHPDTPPAGLRRYRDYDVIPTLPATLDALTAKLNAVLDQIDAIPLEQIGTDLGATVAGIRKLVESDTLTRTLTELQQTVTALHATTAQMQDGVAPSLTDTLQQASRTLETLRAAVSDNSSTSIELRRVLQDVSAAARSVRSLTDYLERHPEALLRGKGTL